jgi:hypothetical protein
MSREVAELHGENIVVYDLEIKKTIEQCSKGWASFDEMGVSVGCAFDYRAMRYRVFMDDNLFELVNRLNEADTHVVAFNNISFDNKLLRATSGLPLLKDDELLNNYDMMRVSREALGLKGVAHKGFKLDDHLYACGLPVKTANGAEAPLMWQAGKVGELVDYCLNDVAVERGLFEYMWITGKVASAHTPTPYLISRITV